MSKQLLILLLDMMEAEYNSPYWRALPAQRKGAMSMLNSIRKHVNKI